MSAPAYPSPELLHKIILLQSALLKITDEKQLCETVVTALTGLDLVQGSAICVEGSLVASTLSVADLTPSCPLLGVKGSIRCPVCPFQSIAGLLQIPLTTPRREYGGLILEIRMGKSVDPILPYFQNVAELIALHIENQYSQSEYKRLNRELEKRLEERASMLYKREQHLLLVLDASGMGIWEWDIPTDSLQWNARTYQIFGLQPDAHIDSFGAYLEQVPESDRLQIATEIEQFLKNSTPGAEFHIEHSINRGDQRRWIEAWGRLLPDELGRQEKLLGVVMDITDRKKAEVEAALSKERYQTYMHATSEGIFCIEFDHPVDITRPVEQIITQFFNSHIVEVNESFARMSGFSTKEELIGKSIAVLKGWEDAPANREYLAHFINNGYQLLDETVERKDKSGSTRIVLSSLFGVHSNNTLVRLWGVLRDITTLKTAEEQLRIHAQKLTDQKEFVQKIFDSSPTILYIYDLGERRTVVRNRNVASTMGFSSEQIIAMGDRLFSLLMHPEDIPRILEHNEQLQYLPDHQSASIEYRMKDIHGRWHWVLSYHTPFRRDTQGKVTQVLGASIDITKQKEAEQHSRRNEEELRITLSSIGDGVIVTDLEGKVIRMNGTAEKLTGYNLGEAFRKDIADVFRIINAQTRLPVSDPVAKVLATGKVLGLANHTMLLARDGNEYHIADAASPIIDEAGKVRGVVLVFSDVTESYRLHQQIQEKRDQLELAMSGGELGAWEWTIATDELRFDSRSAQMLGYRIEELEPHFKTIIRLVHEEDYPQVIEKLMTHLKNRTNLFEAEFRVHSRSGEIIWMLSKGKVIAWSETGTPKKVCGILMDITVRKEREREMVLSTERYRTFMKETVEGIYRFEFTEPIPNTIPSDEQVALIYDRARIAEVNESFARMYGYDGAEKLIDMELARFHGGRDIQENIAFLKAFVEHGYRVEHALSFEVDRHGKRKFFSNNVFGILEDGKLVRVWGTQTDVTDMKMKEEALRYHIKELGEQKKFVQKIFDTNPGAMYLFDITENRVILQNHNVADLLGYSEEEIMEMGLEIIPILGHPDDVPRIMEHFEKLRLLPNDEMLNLEYRMKDKEGAWHWFLSYDIPFLRNTDGTVRQILGNATEITELKGIQEKLHFHTRELARANRALENANIRLKELDKMKSEFVSMASHELRTPITAVLGFTQTLLAPDLHLDQGKRHSYLKIVEKEANRLRKLAEGLLDISKIEAGISDLKREPVNLEALLNDIISSWKIASDKRVVIESDDAGKAWFYADKEQLRRVFINILENAFRFGNEVQVRICGSETERKVEISDNGPGIAQEHLTRIFRKFYRVREQRQPGGGSGLGLAIVKDIIDAHGGRIWAESKLGKGTTFHILLPVLKPAPR